MDVDFGGKLEENPIERMNREEMGSKKRMYNGGGC